MESKHSFFPIKYPQLEKFYQDFKTGGFWIPQELNSLLLQDREDWEKAPSDIRELISNILTLFSELDGIVIENLVERFKKDIGFLKECRLVYSAQEFNEWIHNETYGLLLNNLINDEKQLTKMRNAVHNFDFVGQIANWCYKFMDKKIPITERIIAFACIEGIIFQSAFAAIYWVKTKNLFPGICKSNEWIARDEGLHMKFACILYLILITYENFEPVKEVTAQHILKSAIDIADNFIECAIPQGLLGLSQETLKNYVRKIANVLLISLGFNEIFECPDVPEWMVVVSLPGKSNFFETLVTEYGRSIDSDIVFSMKTRC